jgi:hypothetical protein
VPKRVLTVERIDLRVSDQGLYVFVEGTVPTPGWSNLILQPMEETLSHDGVLDLEFVGNPPRPPVMSKKPVPVATQYWLSAKDFEIDHLVGVLVHARKNNDYAARLFFDPADLQGAIKPTIGDSSPVISRPSQDTQ